MKVTFDIDCTPEEARRFLGFPDLAPVHAAYVERMTKMAADGVTPDMMGEMMRSWAPMGEAGTQMFKTMMGQMGLATGAAPTR